MAEPKFVVFEGGESQHVLVGLYLTGCGRYPPVKIVRRATRRKRSGIPLCQRCSRWAAFP